MSGSSILKPGTANAITLTWPAVPIPGTSFSLQIPPVTITEFDTPALEARVTALESLVAALQTAVAALQAGGSTTGGGTPPDTNAYPLKMPANVASAAPVTLGTGPDQIQLVVSNQLKSNAIVPNAELAIVIDGVVVAGPLTVTGNVGEDTAGSQVFTIQGSWGTGPHVIQIVGEGTGIDGMFINGVTYNLLPYIDNLDGGTSTFANGSNTTWGPQTAASTTPPPPVPPLSTISATINGAAATGTLVTLMNNTPTGGVLALPAGTFVGTGPVPNACTISGAGPGKTILDVIGLPLYEDKAIILPMVPGTTITNMTLSGAHIGASLGADACAVRDNTDGIGFTLDTVEVTNCDDGVLTFASNIAIKNSNFHDNGVGLIGGSATHEAYINGSPTTKVTVSNSTFSTGPGDTHAFKSRAGTTLIDGSTLTGGEADNGNISGSVIDIPNGGTATISNSTIVLRPGAAVDIFIGYAEENANNLATGNTLTLTNVVVDGGGVAGQIMNGSFVPTAKLVLSGCTYKGNTPPTISGFASVSGSFTKAAA